jgi:hypothetical protein
VLTVPASIPVSIFTCSGIAAEAFATAATSNAAAKKHLVRVMFTPKGPDEFGRIIRDISADPIVVVQNGW